MSRVIYGHKKYTELELGNVNILISVPHNGMLRPLDIENRSSDVFGSLKSDRNTRRLGITLRSELERLFYAQKGRVCVPFMIVNNLHRVKMDPNRNPLDAYANYSDDAHFAYNDYHSLIEDNFKHSGFTTGLIIDLHGHSHVEDWIELGYCLNRIDLNKKTLMPARSSVDALIRKGALSTDEIIRGTETSLGGLLESRFNLKCVPSPGHPAPAPNANYYSGGYITEVHGREPFVAIQVEVPASLRADESVDLFAMKLASALFEFYFIHFFDSIF